MFGKLLDHVTRKNRSKGLYRALTVAFQTIPFYRHCSNRRSKLLIIIIYKVFFTTSSVLARYEADSETLLSVCNMVCIPNISSYRVFDYTIRGEYSSSMVALSTTRIALLNN